MLCGAIIRTGLVCKQNIEQRFIPDNLMGDPGGMQPLRLHLLQGFADGARLFILAGAAQDFHGF